MTNLTGLHELFSLDPDAEPIRGFSVAEFEARLTRVQVLMQEANIDVLLLTTEADVRYFSGFQTQFWQSPTRPWYLLVPILGKPVAIIPGIGVECMRQTWIDDIRSWTSPHANDDGVSLLSATLVELAGDQIVIGIPMGRESHARMPLKDIDRVKALLRSAVWQDANTVLQRTRQIKSPAEIAKIRHVCQLVSNVFEQLPHFIKPGMSELDVFRAFKIACLMQGVDDPAYLVGGANAGGYSDIISPASTRLLQQGDLLMLDTGCVWDGYFCDFDRNYAIHNGESLVNDTYRILWDATEAGIAAAVPGARCADVFTAMHQVVEKHSSADSRDAGRLGHGLGMQLTEPPSIVAFDQTIIEPGMVLTLEPGYYFAPGRMMVHEENIVIRDSGAELLTRRAPEYLPVVG